MDSPKYNRTFHVPWSKGATNDDKIGTDLSRLINNPIIITEKMDGSNTSLEADGCFARTHSGPPAHASFAGLKALHASVKFRIPENMQLFGEWCFALHSIAYSELPSYFMIFGARYLKNTQGEARWGSWSDINMWAGDIGVATVPELYCGKVSSIKELEELTNSFMNQPSACGGIREGVVVRVANSFMDSAFSQSVMKCVRANHVSPNNDHWLHKEIIKNQLLK